MMFDEAEFAKTLEYFGGATLPEPYLSYLRARVEPTGSIGYEAFERPHLLDADQMRVVAEGHFWGREFLPFMANSHAFVAFDLRAPSEGAEPPIVFLDWDDEDDYEIRYDKVQRLASNLSGFLGLLGIWQRSDDLPPLKHCYDPGPYVELALVPDPLIFPSFAGAGDVLRSGRFGAEELRVGTLMECVEECPEAPELVEELTVRRVWERIRPVVGDRVIPFMTGDDGWLALDYRIVDRDPSVVFIKRDGDMPDGEPRKVADSVLAAYDLFT